MGVSLRLLNFDDMFHRHSSRVPIIINDFSETSEEDKEALNLMIYTKYSTDLLSNLPSCKCGEVVGQHNARDGDRPGVICSNCHVECTAPLEQKLEAVVWMKAPEGVRALMNPIVWTMLCGRLTRSGFEVSRWLTDTTYKPTVKFPAVMEQVQELNIPRGYNHFIDHFEEITDALFDLKGFKTPGAKMITGNFFERIYEKTRGKIGKILDKLFGTKSKREMDPLHLLLKEQRDCIFSQYAPIPNRALLVIEETNVGTYVDPIVTGAVDAIRTIVGIDSPLSSHSVRTKENRTVKALAQMAAFHDELARTTLAKKEGIFRKHVFGTRSHFSFRGVISSLTDKHDYDEIHIPWGIGVSLLNLHLTGKLLRRGFTPNEAKAFLYEHAQKYHPLLDELFKLLISECPYKGLPVVFQRNPSLERGSAQAMFITTVKSDVEVPTVSLSILSVVGYNADFDGDQLNGTLAIDLMTAEQLRKLAPHMSVFGLDTPRAVTRNLSIPKPVVATIANWIHWPDNEVEIDKLQRMEAIPDAAAFGSPANDPSLKRRASDKAA